MYASAAACSRSTRVETSCDSSSINAFAQGSCGSITKSVPRESIRSTYRQESRVIEAEQQGLALFSANSEEAAQMAAQLIGAGCAHAEDPPGVAPSEADDLFRHPRAARRGNQVRGNLGDVGRDRTLVEDARALAALPHQPQDAPRTGGIEHCVGIAGSGVDRLERCGRGRASGGGKAAHGAAWRAAAHSSQNGAPLCAAWRMAWACGAGAGCACGLCDCCCGGGGWGCAAGGGAQVRAPFTLTRYPSLSQPWRARVARQHPASRAPTLST